MKLSINTVSKSESLLDIGELDITDFANRKYDSVVFV
jgi:hypothetical protein